MAVYNNPTVFFDIYQVLDEVRTNIKPEPLGVSLVLKDTFLLIRITALTKEKKLIAYDLELSFFDTLCIKSVEDVQRAVQSSIVRANNFFKYALT